MRVELIAVPYDSAHRGTRMGAGPERLIEGGLVRQLEHQGHQIGIRVLTAPATSWRAEIRTAFDLAGAVSEAVEESRASGAFPLVLSGNCGPAALGCVSGLRQAPLVFWFDAHGDFNTPDTTIAGFLDGMSLATLTGRCWPQLASSIPGFEPLPEDRVTLLGARDLDPLEVQLLDHSRVRRLSVDGLRRELPAALEATRSQEKSAYVHLDLDVLDPGEAQVNPYQAPNGLGREDVAWAIGAIAEGVRIETAALTAYDPGSDQDGSGLEAAIALGVALVRAVARQHGDRDPR